MGPRSSHLRLSVSRVETPDHVVEQLAAAARASSPSPAAGRRVAVAVAAVIGVLVLSVGGAWATGAVHIPGLPDVDERSPQPTPTAPLDPASPSPAGSDPGAPTGDSGDPFSPADPSSPEIDPEQEGPDPARNGDETGRPDDEAEPGKTPEDPKTPKAGTPGADDKAPKGPDDKAPKGPKTPRAQSCPHRPSRRSRRSRRRDPPPAPVIAAGAQRPPPTRRRAMIRRTTGRATAGTAAIPRRSREAVADDTLVAAAKQGDPQAWRSLHQAHAGRLIAWLSTRPTGDSVASPEDVAAEAWLVAASKIADFDGSSSDFAGYLFGIARKVSASTHRRSQRRRTEPGEVETYLPSEPDPTLVIDAQDWVRDAIASLPDRERDAVGLVDGLGFDNRAAADALGISTVAVRVARHRGLRKLRGRLPPGE